MVLTQKLPLQWDSMSTALETAGMRSTWLQTSDTILCSWITR